MSLRNSAVIGQQFAFSYGRMGVLQQFLLSSSDLDRLLGAHDVAEADQILSEWKLVKLVDAALNTHQAILDACTAWVHRDVRSMCPPERRSVFDILWLEGDMPLLAFLLKQQRGLTSSISVEPTPAYSAIPAAAIRNVVLGQKDDNLPSQIADVVRLVQDQGDSTPRSIDTAVAQAVADLRLALARQSGSPAIRTYVRHQIDIQNIRTALRLVDAPADEVLPELLRGGTVSVDRLTGTRMHIAAAIRISGISYRLADLLDRQDPPAKIIERMLSDILAGDIEAMWNQPLRIEPLFAFAATVLAQLQVVRVIFMGKRNALSPQQIKEMLPPFLTASHYILTPSRL